MSLNCSIIRNTTFYENEADAPKAPFTFTVFSSLLFCTTMCYMFNKWRVPIPLTALVLILGLLLGFCSIWTALIDFSAFSKNMVIYLYFYTPAVIYKIAFGINLVQLKKAIFQILIISTAVFVVTTIFIGMVMREIIEPAWHFDTAFQFGVSCTPIYPVDVVKHLKSLGSYTEPVSIILEGEALFGLATAMILTLLNYAYTLGYSKHWYQFLFVFCRFILIGITTGTGVGYILCYIMRTFCFDLTSLLVFTIAAPFVTFNIVAIYFGATGVITVIIMALMMGQERKSLPAESIEVVNCVWDIIVVLCTTMLSLTAGVMTSYTISRYMQWLDAADVVMTYVVTHIGRFIGFLLFSPILHRIGVEFHYSNILIFVWGGLKSRISLGLVRMFFPNIEENSDINRVFVMHTVILYWASLFINGTTTPLVCSLLKLSDATLSRQVNMHNCLMYIYKRKHESMNIMKTVRLMAEIDWNVVHEMTTFKHPYEQVFRYRRNEVNFFLDYDIANYPGVVRETIINKKTYEKMRDERNRVQNVKKLFYAKLQHNGMIGTDVASKLMQIDNASNDIREMMAEMNHKYNKIRKESFLIRIIRFIEAKLNIWTYNIRLPQSYWRRKVYHFLQSKPYNIGKYTLYFLHIFSMLTQSVYNLSYDYNASSKKIVVYITLFLIQSFFYITDTLEIILKIYSYSRYSIIHDGIPTYFRLFWNILHFFTHFIYTNYYFRYLIHFIYRTEFHADQFRYPLIFFKTLRAMEILSYFEFWNARIFLSLINAKQENNRKLLFEMLFVFLKGEVEMTRLLPRVIANRSIRQRMQKRINKNMFHAKQQIGEIIKERQWISTTVKTRHAILTILDAMQKGVDDLKLTGWLDEVEYINLIKSLQRQYKYLSILRQVSSSGSRSIMREIPWLIDDTLYDSVIIRNVNEGEVVCKKGRSTDGIYIVTSGLFTFTFEPNEDTKTNLEQYGVLPIIDIITSNTFSEPIYDFIMIGGIFGAMATLSKRTYDSTIIAAVHSQVLLFSNRVIDKAILMDAGQVNGLSSRIWKEIDANIAYFALIANIKYKTQKTEQELKLQVYRGFTPELKDMNSFTVKNKLIQDLVLIEGIVMNRDSKEYYKAPCLIPKHVEYLVLNVGNVMPNKKKIRPRLFIIPIENVTPMDVMHANEQKLLVVSTRIENCLKKLENARYKQF